MELELTKFVDQNTPVWVTALATVIAAAVALFSYKQSKNLYNLECILTKKKDEVADLEKHAAEQQQEILLLQAQAANAQAQVAAAQREAIVVEKEQRKRDELRRLDMIVRELPIFYLDSENTLLVKPEIKQIKSSLRIMDSIAHALLNELSEEIEKTMHFRETLVEQSVIIRSSTDGRDLFEEYRYLKTWLKELDSIKSNATYPH